MRVINYFKSLSKIINKKIFGYYCPCCSTEDYNVSSCTARILWDEKYHKYKYYIKCKYCDITTPAYEDIKDAEENFEYLWIKYTS